MKIGILMAGHMVPEMIEEHGDVGDIYERMLATEGFETAVYKVVDGEFPQDPNEADGWIITGSKHGAYEDLPWIPRLEDFIRAVYASDAPMIGICFGHQIIAQAMGGKVVKYAGGWSVGKTSYQIDGDEFSLNAWHQDQVVEVPEDAKVIGHSDFCQNAALVYGKKIMTIQPHPEFDSGIIGGLIERRGKGLVPEDQLDYASAHLAAPNDNARFVKYIARFLRKEA